jgi:hypothetical protein
MMNACEHFLFGVTACAEPGLAKKARAVVDPRLAGSPAVFERSNYIAESFKQQLNIFVCIHDVGFCVQNTLNP